MYLTVRDKIKKVEVGAKAFNLWQLGRWGFKIPETVFIPVTLYHKFLRENGLSGVEREFLSSSGKDTETLQELARKMQKGIMLGDFSTSCREIAVQLADEFQKPLAIRSSSMQEDSAGHSFAGQFLTLLHIKPQAAEILLAIKKVWASQWDKSVISYMNEHAISFRQSAMGVIIQEMLKPQYSGVLFGKEPAAAADNMLIEYVDGLNETLVSGEKTPRQIRYGLAKKKFREKDIPSFASELVRQTLRLQKKTGYPVDVEWSIQNGEIYCLQFRPITVNMESVLWTDENVGEVIPDIVTPYSWSILEPVTNRAFADFLKSIGVNKYPRQGLFGLFRGKVYFNHTAFNALLQEFYVSKKIGFSKIPHLIVFGVKAGWLNLILPRRIEKYLARSRREFEKQQGNSALAGNERIHKIRDILFQHRKTMSLHIACTIFAELYYQFLDKLCRKWLGEHNQFRADRLLSGQKKAESAQSGRALMNIALQIAQLEKLKKLFISAEISQIEALLKKEARGPEILEKINDFIREFGHGSMHEFELFYPRWYEDRAYIYTNLKNYLLKGDPRQWIEQDKKVTERSRAFFLKAKKELPFLKKWLFARIFKRSALFAAQRENLKQTFVKRHALLKQNLLLLGQEGCEQGILQEARDILFLTEEEIERWFPEQKFPGKSLQLIEERKAEREKNMGFEHPAKIRQLGKNWYPEQSADFADEHSLQGIGCSAGVAEGKACVIRNPEEFAKLKKGDVLIAPSTNPGWTPLFVSAAAVVTEIGGALSHGAIIAREYGLPMVAAVPQITRILKDGQRVKVDGHNGFVTLIE